MSLVFHVMCHTASETLRMTPPRRTLLLLSGEAKVQVGNRGTESAGILAENDGR